MPTRVQIGVVVAVVVALLVAALTVAGDRPPLAPLVGVLSGVVTASVIVAILYDRLLWHLWPVSLIFPKPDIRGTWKGRFESVDPASGLAHLPRGCFLVVRQSGFHLRVDMLTNESRSKSISAQIQHDEHRGAELLGVYKNEPRPQVLAKSRPHTGAFAIRIQGARPTVLAGTYWTDRGSAGEMTFDQRHGEAFDDHETAAAAMAG